MMAKQYCIPLESCREWREALSGIRHEFGHTWENCHAMYLTSGLRTYLYCLENGGSRIVAPIAERDFDGYVDIAKPYGFSGFVGTGDWSEFPEQWGQFVRERGYVCGYLGLNPLYDCSGHFPAGDVHVYDEVFVIDLRVSDEELMAGLTKSFRRRAKALDSLPVELVYEKAELEGFFLETFTEFHLKKHAASHYFLSDESLKFLFNADNVRAIGMKSGGKVVAICLCGSTPDVCDGLFNLSLPEGREYSFELCWLSIMRARARGVSFFNLGGGGGGVGEFKRRFGASPRPLKCLKQVYRPEAYDRLCHVRNINPADCSGYFPLYRKIT